MVAEAIRVRSASAEDAAACAEIYAPYVTSTDISFELEPPTAAQFADRIADAKAEHEWLVAERYGVVVGYAYGHRFAERAAYQWSCETSIYLAPDVRGLGIGSVLYQRLLTCLADQGYRRAFAGITLPNDASVGLHRRFGFEQVGCYRRVGWKNAAWHDVAWMQRDLQAVEADPPAFPGAAGPEPR